MMLVVLLTACDPSSDPRDADACDADAGSQGVDAGSRREDAGAPREDAGMAAVCTFDALALLADPYLPARLLPGRMHLASSRQPEPADGMGNDDFNHYLRVDGTQHVLMEAEGPGVVTRLWFTGREPATQDYTVLDRVILHVEVDGAEVAWTEGANGFSLGELTSGSVPGFPRPWVAGRDIASDGLIVSVPIPFSSSIRFWVEPPPGNETLFFYQVDWRSLPAGTIVESFDGVVSDAESAALDDATAVWVDHTMSAEAADASDHTIPPCGSVTLPLAAPTTVRAIAVDMVDGALDALHGELTVDGASVATGELARWTFALAPTIAFDTALASVEPGSFVRFRYPFPVRESGQLVLMNASAAPVTVHVELEHDPGRPDADLAALRTSCDSLSSPPVGENMTLIDLTDRRGQYAGLSLILRSQVDGYWSGLFALEGDHEVFADDDEILGTGTEDYFGGSFYYYPGGPFALPLSAASGIVGATRVQVPQLRHHLLDTIPFDHRFRFTFETFVEASEWDECVYWYEDTRAPGGPSCPGG